MKSDWTFGPGFAELKGLSRGYFVCVESSPLCHIARVLEFTKIEECDRAWHKSRWQTLHEAAEAAQEALVQLLWEMPGFG